MQKLPKPPTSKSSSKTSSQVQSEADSDDETGKIVNGEEDDVDDDEEESGHRDPPIGHVRLRPSQFVGIPSTVSLNFAVLLCMEGPLFVSSCQVFVEYPRELGIRRTDVSVLEALGSRKLFYNCYWERFARFAPVT